MADPFLPFQPGQTFFGGTPDNAYQQNHMLGCEFTLVDNTYGTGRFTTYRVVRNLIASQAAVFAGALAILDKTGTTIIGVTNADAYGSPAVAAGPLALVDGKLGSGGCAYQDICFVAVQGLALAETSYASGAENVINVGDFLNAATYNGATTATTTGGRVKTRLLSSSVTAAQAELEAVFARALSAATTANTNTLILVDVIRRL